MRRHETMHVLVSYDVKSLFTDVPVEESLPICHQRLADKTWFDGVDISKQTIIRLLRFCLTATAFHYNGKHYKQLDGVAMGSPVSSALADIFIEDLEGKAFSKYPDVPRVWHRFVNKIITVVKKYGAEKFLQHLNNQHPRIQFTMEQEKDRSLPFMDVRFTRRRNGTLARSVYQKTDPYQPVPTLQVASP